MDMVFYNTSVYKVPDICYNYHPRHVINKYKEKVPLWKKY